MQTKQSDEPKIKTKTSPTTCQLCLGEFGMPYYSTLLQHESRSSFLGKGTDAPMNIRPPIWLK